MIGALDVGSLALLAGIVLALAVPCLVVYVWGAYQAHREIRAHEQREAGRRRSLEDRVARLEREDGRDAGRDGLPDASTGVLLHDPEPPAAGDPRGQALRAGGAAGSRDRPGEDRLDAAAGDEDPWMRAFGGCLRGREVLDREQIPQAASRNEDDADTEG